MCTQYPATDKPKILSGEKIMTFRPLSCNIKGGKDYVLMCERVKGGFCTAYIDKPFIYDIRLMTDQIAKLLGFETVEEYMDQPYNKNNSSYFRKAYIISNVRPNL